MGQDRAVDSVSDSESTRTSYVGAAKKKSEMTAESDAALQSTKGLAAKAAQLKAKPVSAVETDESKMSPLALLAYRAKKKRDLQATAVEKK